MKEAGISERSHFTVFVPQLHVLPESLAKLKIELDYVSHCQVINRYLLCIGQLRHKANSARRCIGLKNAEWQGNQRGRSGINGWIRRVASDLNAISLPMNLPDDRVEMESCAMAFGVGAQSLHQFVVSVLKPIRPIALDGLGSLISFDQTMNSDALDFCRVETLDISRSHLLCPS